MINQTTTSLEKTMSDTPRTEAAIIKDLHGNEVLYEGCRIARATEMALLERELAEARESSVYTHGRTTASAKGWALMYEAAINQRDKAREQRDTLAEALEMVMTDRYGDGQCDNGYSPRYVAKQALASVKGGES